MYGRKPDIKKTGRRKNISCALLFICLLMQVAMAFPHHHHSDLYCFHADLLPCESESRCTDGMHHTDDEDKHACDTACVSQFRCGIPQHSLSDWTPDYSFYAVLYSFAGDLFRFVFPELTAFSESSVYIEGLHGRLMAHASGRRAPPVV